MEAAGTPKRPLTPFFLFREKQKEKGVAMGGKEAGAKWQAMSEEEKKPYIEMYHEARDKFDAYLEEEGITPRKSSARKSGLLGAYKPTRVRSVLGASEDIKNLTMKQCRALAQVAVRGGNECVARIREGPGQGDQPAAQGRGQAGRYHGRGGECAGGRQGLRVHYG